MLISASGLVSGRLAVELSEVTIKEYSKASIIGCFFWGVHGTFRTLTSYGVFFCGGIVIDRVRIG